MDTQGQGLPPRTQEVLNNGGSMRACLVRLCPGTGRPVGFCHPVTTSVLVCSISLPPMSPSPIASAWAPGTGDPTWHRGPLTPVLDSSWATMAVV